MTDALGNGAHALPAGDYHADPCEQPSLSASIAHILCTRSPWHAWACHPRLNPDFEPREDSQFDIGSAVHALKLENLNYVVVVPYDDWRTNAAKDIRDKARAEGKIPLLARAFEEVKEMLIALERQLAEHHAEPPLFADGKPEQTLVWEEPGGVICRARLDWLRDDRLAIDDLKTTTRSASPEAFSRSLYGIGADVQAAMYRRGVQELFGETPEFRWVVIETAPPFALSVVSPGPDVLELGTKKVEYALDAWRRCMATGNWPGYSREIRRAELPPWEEAAWLEKEVREAAA